MSQVQAQHVVLTGPIVGDITLDDGTVYNVNPYAVEVDPAHADELAEKIAQHYVENGHPMVQGDFVYDPNPQPENGED